MKKILIFVSMILFLLLSYSFVSAEEYKMTSDCFVGSSIDNPPDSFGFYTYGIGYIEEMKVCGVVLKGNGNTYTFEPVSSGNEYFDLSWVGDQMVYIESKIPLDVAEFYVRPNAIPTARNPFSIFLPLLTK